MDKYCKNCFELAEKLKEKEQECEELKEKNRNLILLNQDLHNKFKTSKKVCRCKDEVIDRKQTETNRYKQALEKIEEHIKKEIVCDDCNLIGTKECDSGLCESFYLNDFCEKLLQVINEVKNGR